jgi:hypothetical protein
MLEAWDRLQDLRRGSPVEKTDITKAIADRTDSLTIERLLLKKGLTVDRLKEKLTKAAGVAPRLTVAIEKDADDLIARETQLMTRKDEAFKPHFAVLDSHKRDLDQLEDALKVVENGLPNSEG